MRFLGESAPSMYFASHLLHVRELVIADVLHLPPGANSEVLRLIDAAAALHVPVLA